MKYKLVYTHRASKDILKLDQSAKKRIGKALKKFAEEPFKHASKLTDPALGTYRFRIGNFRVVFDVEDTEIVVLRIGHRKDIYRNL